MPRLNRAAQDQALQVIETLARCYHALSRENAPTPELRRYLDRIQATATKAGIDLTPRLRALIYDRAQATNDEHGTMDLHK
jgi:hypothetical protein